MKTRREQPQDVWTKSKREIGTQKIFRKEIKKETVALGANEERTHGREEEQMFRHVARPKVCQLKHPEHCSRCIGKRPTQTQLSDLVIHDIRGAQWYAPAA